MKRAEKTGKTRAEANKLEDMFDRARAVAGAAQDQRVLAVRGAREHNLKNVDLVIPRDRLVVFTGPVRVGQVVARVRHDLRRGPAPLCREPVGLCAPVPRDDAEAGRRPDRRALAGHLHRAEDDVARIRARRSAPSPRSTTTCACSGRASACPIRPRPACRSRARRSRRWWTACSPCPRRRASTCWRPSCAAARASTARNWRISRSAASSA